MSLLALGAAWAAVATVAGLALAAAVRRNTTRTRPLPLRDPGVALAEARMVDRLQQAIDDYETCADLENRTWKENQS